MHQMMKYVAFSVCGVAFVSVAGAMPIVALDAGATDVDRLLVGQTVEIAVNLDELPEGTQLDSLATSVKFDGELLGVPSIQAGEILPDPLNEPGDFLVSEDVGLADAAFLTFGTETSNHIASNGTFFTFRVTPVQLGSGTVAFEFAGATQFDPDGPLVIELATGPDLTFTVVPEPSACLMLLIGIAILIRRRVRRR